MSSGDPEIRRRRRFPMTHSIMLVLSLLALSCGTEQQGSTELAAEKGRVESEVGERWRIEATRTGVARPIFIRWDTATGEVTYRPIMGRGSFEPVAQETPPAADEAVQLGRFEVSVIPATKGASLLRLDTVTGRVWIVKLRMRTWRWIELPTDASQKAARSGPLPKIPVSAPAANTASVVPKLEILLELLSADDTTSDILVVVASMLATHYPESAAEPLLEVLRTTPDSEVAITVIEVLPLDRDPSIAAKLEPFTEHADQVVAAAAQKKLGTR